MVFCNKEQSYINAVISARHNPYFNRWFSAIAHIHKKDSTIPISHNPYFNRWFSAINCMENKCSNKLLVTILILIDGFLQFIKKMLILLKPLSHNPYFNRWFSAMEQMGY